jgi:hypothetical protein
VAVRLSIGVMVRDESGLTTSIAMPWVRPSGLGVAESVTITVNCEAPTARAEPVIVPVAASSVRPLGNDPDTTDHVYGATPPEADRETE